MRLTRKEIIDLFEGEEHWTNVFGARFEERVCVLFDNGTAWVNGKKFTPTVAELKAFFHEYSTEGEGFFLLQEAKLEFAQPCVCEKDRQEGKDVACFICGKGADIVDDDTNA